MLSTGVLRELLPAVIKQLFLGGDAGEFDGWSPVSLSRANMCWSAGRTAEDLKGDSRTRPEELRSGACGGFPPLSGLTVFLLWCCGSSWRNQQIYCGWSPGARRDSLLCWIWAARAAPGDLLSNGSSQFLDTETGFCQELGASPQLPVTRTGLAVILDIFFPAVNSRICALAVDV